MTEQRTDDVVPAAVALRDGRRAMLRPVRVGDKREIQDAFTRLSFEARYTRFMAPLKELPPAMLERTVNPLPDREVALVAIADASDGEDIVGGARFVADERNEACEFAIVIADEWRGVGLASHLMNALIAAASARGIARMEGFVLANNRSMLNLARRLGFTVGASSEGPSVKLVQRQLLEPRERKPNAES